MPGALAPTLSAPLRRRALALVAAVVFVLVATGLCVTSAHADTDTWCNNCTINPGTGRQSRYDHHFTLVYSHDLSFDDSYVGAGVIGYDRIAHGYVTATHSYSAPVLAYGWGENTTVDWYAIPMDIHGDF
jgi:hypothetical protein